MWEEWIGRLGLVYSNRMENNQVLQYSTGNYIQYPVIMEKNMERMLRDIYITESLCYTAEINRTL